MRYILFSHSRWQAAQRSEMMKIVKTNSLKQKDFDVIRAAGREFRRLFGLLLTPQYLGSRSDKEKEEEKKKEKEEKEGKERKEEFVSSETHTNGKSTKSFSSCLHSLTECSMSACN
jgi:hypothetical protein